MTAQTMSTPLPIRPIEYALNHWRYPAATVAVLVAAPLFIAFIAAGAFRPLAGYDLWNRPLEIIGLFLILAFLPACLFAWFTLWERSRTSLFADIEAQLKDSSSDGAGRNPNTKYWPIALLVGVAYAVVININPSSLSLEPGTEIFWVSIALSCGQIFLWSTVSLTLFFVLLDDLELFRYGSRVTVNVYDLDRLNGFGRAAVNQFLMVIGAFAFSALQSLDREFQWVNYANGLYVAVPSAILFILLPTWTIRKNIKAAKASALDIVNKEIQSASTELDTDSLTRMNGLVARREQIQHLRNWPMDTSIFSRFLFYIFIPPLAWLGAALMEVMLDSFLAA